MGKIKKFIKKASVKIGEFKEGATEKIEGIKEEIAFRRQQAKVKAKEQHEEQQERLNRQIATESKLAKLRRLRAKSVRPISGSSVKAAARSFSRPAVFENLGHSGGFKSSGPVIPETQSQVLPIFSEPKKRKKGGDDMFDF